MYLPHSCLVVVWVMLIFLATLSVSAGRESSHHYTLGLTPQPSSTTTTKNRLTGGTTATIRPTPQPRTACRFYLWNAPSALLHRWCQHMMKDHVYEGRGGVKFVRIEPGSILQLLYPCSRYSPDSCLFCGGNFEDHMTLRWAKQLYTPLDRYLDAVRDMCVLIPPQPIEKKTTTPRHRGRRRRSSAQQDKRSPAQQSSFPKHVFHRLYVQEDNAVVVSPSNKKVKKKKNGRQGLSKQRENVFFRQCEHVRYQIPFREVTFLRAITLAAVEALIRLEKGEDGEVQRRWSKHAPCC